MLRSLLKYYLVFIVSCGASSVAAQETFMRPLVKNDTNGLVTLPIINLMNLSKIEVFSTSLQSVVDATQKVWLRQKGNERWDIKPSSEDLRGSFMSIFKDLQMVSDIKPTKKHYDYAIICGGTASRMRARLASLKKAWVSGVRFDVFVSHTSHRPRSLDPAAGETDNVLINAKGNDISTRADWVCPQAMPTNEAEMFEFIFDQADLPQEMREVRRIKVVAPMKPDKEGKLTVRATTADCIKLFIEQMDTKALAKGGTCIVVSSNPYIWFQDTVFRHHMPIQFMLESMGPAAQSEDVFVAVYLDTLARWLYEELQIEKKNNNKKTDERLQP